MKKRLCLGLVLLLLLALAPGSTVYAKGHGHGKAAQDSRGDAQSEWVDYDYNELTVGNPTHLEGKFFTGMWGGSTSDLDVQELLHGYSLVRWDGSLGRMRFDRSVVSGAACVQDANGNRTYSIVLYDDLRYSDGTPITAYDYAFTLLLQVDPVIGRLGGTPMDAFWLLGIEVYLSGEAQTLAGLRILGDHHLAVTVKAEALPYFYELARLNIKPTPIAEIAPGCDIRDEGEGAFLTLPLEEEKLRETILDPESGYLSHPQTVSGPYRLVSFDGVTAAFRINEEYKGNEAGIKPQIQTLYYTVADNADMIKQLQEGQFGLLNKATLSDTVLAGIRLAQTQGHQFTMQNYPRIGLTLLWFVESSPRAQEEAVRKAVAYCMDREAFAQSYVGPFGMVMDGLYGMGEWMYLLANGTVSYEVPLSEAPTEEEMQAYEAETAEWDGISLDGLTKYALNVQEAVRLLEEAGWTLNEEGAPYDPARDEVRCKRIGEEIVPLTLTVMLPQSEKLQSEMEIHFLPYLRHAGFRTEWREAGIEQLQAIYEGMEAGDADLIYLGDNFRTIFDPDLFLPRDEDLPLAQVKAELRAMAQDMVHTEPGDLLSFMKKWVALQEKITETVPLIPVYSNMYFDFYTRELYDYDIREAVTWPEAIIPAYLNSPETYDEKTDQSIVDELDQMEQLFE